MQQQQQLQRLRREECMWEIVNGTQHLHDLQNPTEGRLFESGHQVGDCSWPSLPYGHNWRKPATRRREFEARERVMIELTQTDSNSPVDIQQQTSKMTDTSIDEMTTWVFNTYVHAIKTGRKNAAVILPIDKIDGVAVHVTLRILQQDECNETTCASMPLQIQIGNQEEDESSLTSGQYEYVESMLMLEATYYQPTPVWSRKREMLSSCASKHEVRKAVIKLQKCLEKLYYNKDYGCLTTSPSNPPQYCTAFNRFVANAPNVKLRPEIKIQECPVCYEEQRTNRTFGVCGHYCCRRCVSNIEYNEEEEAVLCPICRAEIPMET